MFFSFFFPWLPPFPGRQGVGQQPPPVPPVRRPDISRRKDAVVPCVSSRIKLGEDDVSPTAFDAGRIFEEYPFRSKSINCTADLEEQAAPLPGEESGPAPCG